MTIDETIYCMKSYLPDENGGTHCTECKYYKSISEDGNVYTCQSNIAHKMAIKSLEAWNAIRKIFKAKATSWDWEYIHDLQIWEDALEIIDKHLSEVSE